MKRLWFFIARGGRVLFPLSLLTLAACATAADRLEPAPPLKVHVDAPAAWNPILDPKTPEAIVARVREVFYRRGFYRKIEGVRSAEDPAKLPYLLTIALNEWRIDRAGKIACTFTATLRTPDATRDLGSYTTETMTWLPGAGRFGLSDLFAHGAERAVHALCSDIAQMELLPGLRETAPA